MIQAALFDMDGLLFDTEGLGLEAGVEAGVRMGYPVTLDMCRHLLGVNETESTLYLQQFFPDLNGEIYWQHYADIMRSHILKSGTPLKRGCVEIIKALQEMHIPYALVSSSSRHVIDFYLAHSPLDGAFPVIVSGDLGLKSKPAPDCFLKGAELLQIAPAACCVLEDSLHGLRAGRNAGMHTIMVPDIIPYGAQHEGLCDYVAADLHDALRHIKEVACSQL